jgi:site-specific DNA recombinase
MNRYPFSSKIRCGECGSTFKRRTHGNADNRYIAWCCSKHIDDSGQCSMRFIREDSIERAFVVMINKLITGHSIILKPLVASLKKQDSTGNLTRINELDKRIEENAERGRVLIGLMTKGYLDPALFNTQNNEHRMEATKLKEQKEALSHTVNGGLTAIAQAELLLKYAAKAEGPVDSFDEGLFDRFVDGIAVYTPTEIGFKLKCGITLREKVEQKKMRREEIEDGK